MPLRPDAPTFQPSISATAHNVHPVDDIPVPVDSVSKNGNQGKSLGNRKRRKQKQNSQKKTGTGNATRGNESVTVSPSSQQHDNGSPAVPIADIVSSKAGQEGPKKSNKNRRRNKHKKNLKTGCDAKPPSTGQNRYKGPKNNVNNGFRNDNNHIGASQNFPALVTDKPAVGPHNFPGGEKETQIVPGVWASVAATAANTPPDSIGGSHEEQEHPILMQNGNDGVRLTLLRAGRTDNNNATKPVDPATLHSEKLSSQRDIENGELAVKPGLENKDDEGYSVLKRQAPRIDMSKLRDRWWVLLRQQRALQQQKEAEEKEEEQKRILARQQSGGASSSTSDDEELEEEYVELSPLKFYNGQAEKKTTSEEQALVMEMDHLRKYLECPLPLHYAILNHDREALGALLELPPNMAATVQAKKDKRLGKNVEKWSPFQLAVRLDKPDLLSLLLRANYIKDDQARRPTPLMIAAELGHEDCAQVLLSSTSAVALVAAKDSNGNNALHYCCGSILQGGGSVALLQRLLEVVVHAGGTLPSKVLPCKNHSGQTPMHVACQQGRVELVETFLASLGNSSCFNTFLKVLSVKDEQEQTPLLAAIASGSTDLVMTLLMWRGNHHHHHMGTKQRQKASAVSIEPKPASSDSKGKPDVCPLVWAIKTPETNSADMVRLLLEFHAPLFLNKASTSVEAGYDLTHALHEAVLRSSSQRSITVEQETDTQLDSDMLEIIRALVEAGANPCEERLKQRQQVGEQSFLWRETRHDAEPADSGEEAKKATTGHSGDNKSANVLDRVSGTNALTLAAAMGHVPTMAALLDSLISYRRNLVVSRRRDPTLSKQPESFFRGLEKMEEEELAGAVSEALVTCLYLGFDADIANAHLLGDGTSNGQPEKLPTGLQPSCHRATSDEYLACGLVLFRRGARLGSTCLARLKCSLGTSILRRSDEVLSGNDGGLASARIAPGSCGLGGLPACHCYNFRTGYHRENVTLAEGDGGRVHSLSMEDRSQLVRQLPWMKKTLREHDDLHCGWMKEQTGIGTDKATKTRLEGFGEALQSDLVALVTDHGAGRVIVHGSIVSQQSAKLAAAIRWARNSHGRCDNSPHNEHVEKSLLEIDLSSAPTKLVILMLQHLYHGSITCGLDPSEALCREELLDLLLLSEEFLCPSLAQECEMRLLSDSPWRCFCWSCNRATTVAATTNPFGYASIGEECIYSVEGPSRLITPEAVLDVVAVAQHIEEAHMTTAEEESYVMDFAIRLLSPPMNNMHATSSEWTRLAPTKPVACLREVATTILLYNFVEVLQSEAYASQLKDSLVAGIDNDDCKSHQKQHENEAASLLLRMCLDELVLSDFKDAWDLPALSMKRIFAASASASAKQPGTQDVP